MTLADRARDVGAFLGEGFLDLIFPPRCLLCGDFGRVALCRLCVAEFEPAPEPACARCGAAAAAGPAGGPLCRKCADGRAFAFSSARGAFAYKGLVRAAVHRLKYDGKVRLAPALADAMLPALGALPVGDRAYTLAPVPLHPARGRDRGFNQSALLCERLAFRTGLAVDTQSLKRARLTHPQVALRGPERQANVDGAFACAPGAVEGLDVLLVDDVLTTLATVNACSRALLAGGASSVTVLALAQD